MRTTSGLSNAPKAESNPREILRDFMTQPFKSFAEIARERHALWQQREKEAAAAPEKAGGKRAA